MKKMWNEQCPIEDRAHDSPLWLTSISTVAMRLNSEPNPKDFHNERELSKDIRYDQMRNQGHVRHEETYFPWIGKQSFQIDLFSTVGTCLFLSNNTPAANTKFVESEGTSIGLHRILFKLVSRMSTLKFVGAFDQRLIVILNPDGISTHRTCIHLQGSFWKTRCRIILKQIRPFLV